MAGAMRVSAGVVVGRAVATADLAALEADAQMEPEIARGQAVLATFDGGWKLRDLNMSRRRALPKQRGRTYDPATGGFMTKNVYP